MEKLWLHLYPYLYVFPFQNIINDRERFWIFNKHKAEAHDQLNLVTAKEIYHRGMATDVENPESRLNSEELEQKHASYKTEALEQFINECLPGGDEFSELYKIELENVRLINSTY